jgi:hypothetical protein
MSGSTTRHEIITDLNPGDKVAQGDVIAWNKDFFERDRYNPRQVFFKIAVLARVALVEKDVTFEDANEISSSLYEKMSCDVPYVHTVRIRFDQDIRNLVSLGDSVYLDDILCTIENSFGDSSVYDEKSRETLSEINNLSPKSECNGVVEEIKVFYNGEIDDMSESLKKLALQSDKKLNAKNALSGKNKISGKTTPGFRIKNQSLADDECAIFITVTSKNGMGIGDKLVFSNQMKSIVSGQVVDGVYETEDGEPVDCSFSYVSFMKRIVESGMVIGTTNTLLVAATKDVISKYRGK